MINKLFDNSTIPVLNEAINFASARHDVLVGNVANMNTPGYQVRDLSVETFQQRLQEAIELRNEQKSSLGQGLSASEANDPIRNVRKSLEATLQHDGTNVGMEQQVMEVSKNQFMHNIAITIMTSQFRLLQTAISERV